MSQVAALKPSSEPNEGPLPDLALAKALDIQKWYEEHAPKERRKYYLVEVAALLVAASITVVGVAMPTDGRLPAALGAVVILLGAVRSLFHWRENWRVYCEASTKLAAAIRAYEAEASLYDGDEEKARAQQLTTDVNTIEMKAVKESSKLVTNQKNHKP